MTEMRFAKSEFEGRYLYIWLRPREDFTGKIREFLEGLVPPKVGEMIMGRIRKELGAYPYLLMVSGTPETLEEAENLVYAWLDRSKWPIGVPPGDRGWETWSIKVVRGLRRT